MFRTSLVLAIAAAVATSLAAQSKEDHAGFIVTLGSDTVAVERYTRTATTLEGDLVTRVPRTRIIHYSAVLGRDGTVSRYEGSARFAADAPAAPKSPAAALTFGPDSVSIEIRIGDSTRSYRMAARSGAAPALGFSYALTEQLIRQWRATGKDSVWFDLVFPGARQPVPTYVARRSADSVAIDTFGNPAMARVDGAGRLLGLDGSATTQKVLVQRVPTVDVDGLATRFAEAEAAGHGIGQLSARDTVRARIGGASLMIDYGRPAKRGRRIFGGIVPWGEVWRTGANAATQFSTDRTLLLGGTELPPGKYTLWTVPTPDGARLIINKQTGQWGTDYDAAQDLSRVALEEEALPAPVEVFLMELVPAGGGGLLRMSWDRTAYSIPFTVR